jgi:hypothetical protein
VRGGTGESIEVTVVLSFPANAADVATFEGDTDEDVMTRAVHERLRPEMEALRTRLPGAHYMLSTPRRVWA